MTGAMKCWQAAFAALSSGPGVALGNSRLSPECPGMCTGSGMATPCARMHRAKFTKSWSAFAWVSPPTAAVLPWCPARLATCGPDAGDEQAAASTAVAITAATAPHARARPDDVAGPPWVDLRDSIVASRGCRVVCLGGQAYRAEGYTGRTR